MTVFTYRCPHCHTSIDVNEEMVGKTVVCPEESCHHPLELEAKSAPLIATAAAEDGEQAEGSVLQDEREVLQLHPAMFRNHPLRFCLLLLIFAASLAGSIVLLLRDGSLWSLAPAILALAVAVYGFVWWLQVIYTTLYLTTKRMILREGIIAKSTSELRHADIRNLRIDQKMIERILNVGDISASSAGQEDIEIVARGFRNPEKIVEQIRRFQG